MIVVAVRIGREDAGIEEVISASSIREAVAIAQARHPEESIRVVYPIDPGRFFPRQRDRSEVLSRG